MVVQSNFKHAFRERIFITNYVFDRSSHRLVLFLFVLL